VREIDLLDAAAGDERQAASVETPGWSLCALRAGDRRRLFGVDATAPELDATVACGDEDELVAGGRQRGIQAAVAGAKLGAGRCRERQAKRGRRRRGPLAVPLDERPREQRGQDEQRGGADAPDQESAL
jgi:hypothetical protein